MSQEVSFRGKGSSVAWFKLAELISRGEKEKALTLYRLLSHSLDERAYVLQLEGDILLAFEDGGAIERYEQAAFLYRNEQKAVAALAIYEHLLTIHPKNYTYLKNIIVLYAQLHWYEKLKEYFTCLLDLLESNEITDEQVSLVGEDVIRALNQTESREFLAFLTIKVPQLAERLTVTV